MAKSSADLHLVETPKRVLNIKSYYYRGKKVVRKNSAGNPVHACGLALEHMRRNDYAATHVEVFDIRTAKVYAVQRRSVTGQINTIFEHEFDPKKGV